MGVVANIGYDIFPKQGKYLGKEVEVCFHYDTSRVVRGKVVRDDAETPYATIIRLTDGRYVSSKECQYRIL